MNEIKKLWVAVIALAVGLVGIYFVVFNCPTYGKNAGACASKPKAACSYEKGAQKSSCCVSAKAVDEDCQKCEPKKEKKRS